MSTKEPEPRAENALSEAFVRRISSDFGEPERILKMRLEALREAAHLPRHELQYGLGIFAKTPDALLANFETNAVRYKFSKTDGVQVLPWNEAVQSSIGLPFIEQYFMPERFPVLKNYYFASSAAGFRSGLAIIADPGANADISIESIFEKSGADMIFAVARRGSTLHIADTPGGGSAVSGRTFFVVAEEGANVEISSTQNFPHESSFFANKFSAVFRGGKVSWLDAHFGGRFVKSDIEDFLLEEGAESNIRNLTLAGTEHFDFYNASHHRAPHTSSAIVARGIAGGGGKIIYRGLVDIGENCPGSRGRQNGRFLIASSGAEIDANPSLDIRSPDVSSSHALSISRIKENDLFYPALRGVEAYPAQAMLFEGFLSHDIINENILALIRKKLSSSVYEIS